VEVLPIPHDCTDGFMAAFWRRPAAYLKPEVRASISSLALTEEHNAEGLARLERDLADGTWRDRYADLVDRDELDAGYRLVIS
jgi:hypothetical protein